MIMTNLQKVSKIMGSLLMLSGCISSLLLSACESPEIVSSVLIEIRPLDDTIQNDPQHALTGTGQITITPYDIAGDVLYTGVSFDLAARQGDVPGLPLGQWRFYVTGNHNNKPVFGVSAPFEVKDNQAISTVTLIGRSQCTGLLPYIVGPEGVGGSSDLEQGYDGSSAVALADGRVLILGGGLIDQSSGRLISVSRDIQIYDPKHGVVTMAAELLSVPRAFHQVTTLDDQRILITGGVSAVSGGQYVVDQSAEMITISENGSLTISQPFLMGTGSSPARYDHLQVKLNDGSVLIAGGRDSSGTILSSATRYFPTDGTFVEQGSMNTPRTAASISALNRSSELAAVIGGISDVGPTNKVEFFTVRSDAGCVPSPTPDRRLGCFTAQPDLNRPRWGHQSAKLNDGSVLIVGGFQGGDLEVPREPIAAIEHLQFISKTEMGITTLSVQINPSVGNLAVSRGRSALGYLLEGDSEQLLLIGGEGSGSQSDVSIINANNLALGIASAAEVRPTCPLSESRYRPMSVTTPEGAVMVFGGVMRGLDSAGALKYTTSRRIEMIYPTVNDIRQVIPSID